MDGGHCAGRARFIANSALSQSKSDIPLYQERRANFLSTPAYENKRCRCLAVYLEPLLLKKYVEHDIFQGSEEDEMGVVDKQ